MRAVAWLANGGLLVSGGNDKTARLWHPATGECLHVLNGAEGSIYDVSLAPGLAVAASNDTMVRLYDLSTGNLRHALKGLDTGARACCASTDGAVVAGAARSYVLIWDVDTGEIRHTLQLANVRTLCFSPDSRVLCVGNIRGKGQIYDVKSGESLREIQGFNSHITSMCFSGCGTYLIISSMDCVVRVFKVASCRCIASYMQAGKPFTSAVLVPGGSRSSSLTALAYCMDGRMLFLDVPL